jgi:hypothetical protein
MEEPGRAISAQGVVFDVRVKNRLTLDAPQFDGEPVLALRITADQREEPKRRQRRAEIIDEKAIEKPHQTEFAALFFAHVVAQGSE